MTFLMERDSSSAPVKWPSNARLSDSGHDGQIIYQCDERRRSFLEAMKCELPLPFKSNVIVISIRLMLDATNSAEVLSGLSEAGDCFNAVKRIICCHLCRAVVIDKNYDSAASFRRS